MTRFDAATEGERRELFVDAIRAHGERESPFLTIEVAVEAPPIPDEDAEDEPTLAPWVQFADGVVNLDCTEDELDRANALLDEYPEFVVDELTRPEEAEGVNLRVAARTDPARVAEFVDRAFQDVYDCAPDYRAWVTAV
ncbi:hypothetical protein [Halococcus hamelinensis]|uniref:DUF7975 domain-containing protein n=1 Tax=Halococcus hamelinensis 100A6 TaxID=1132509 RepID=M0LWJ6_9EURY|nr:hypothetical protein [Halococcus hamelinensis]EMA36739.1 hypothetical protein C447_14069 [Halococcus hamelinensis 100A6]